MIPVEKDTKFHMELLSSRWCKSSLEKSWQFGIHTRPIISEFSGNIKFENVEGVTVTRQIDVTGLSSLVVIDGKKGSSSKTKVGQV